MLKQTYTVGHEIVQSPNKFMHRVQYCSLQKKKKKSRAHPKISRARAQSIWTMKLKINNPVVGMGTNNRRGNVFELKLS